MNKRKHFNEFYEWRSTAKEEYDALLKEAATRTTHQTTEQLLNVNATHAGIRKAPKTTKRKALSVALFPANG